MIKFSKAANSKKASEVFNRITKKLIKDNGQKASVVEYIAGKSPLLEDVVLDEAVFDTSGFVNLTIAAARFGLTVDSEEGYKAVYGDEPGRATIRKIMFKTKVA